MALPPSASSARRFLRLAGTATRIAGGVLGQRLLRGRSGIDWQPVGDLLAEVLGDMKGPVLKLGQMASQWHDVLPEPVSRALGSLQNKVPALPYQHLQAHLQRVYEGELTDYFEHIDEQPFAAASLGQVHRARGLDGQALVLKIQYPGIAAICAADLKQVRRLLPLGRLFRAPAAQLEGVYRELEQTITAELDYAAEMQRLMTFRQFFADWPDVLMPRPIEHLCRPGVLVLTEVPGLSFAEVGQAPDALRQRLAQTLAEWLVAQAFILGQLHADPHPGNFAYTAEGQLVVYDFGCIQRVEASLLAAYVQTFRALQSGRAEDLERGFQSLGTRQPQSAPPWTLYRNLTALLGPLVQPGMLWDFAATPVHDQVQRLIPDALSALGSLQPAPGTLLINRTLEGHYWNLTRLGVALPVADLIERRIKTHPPHSVA
jgi:predicted unusual protein kinase regulating ubiquinone biosynthesis (AarF/ABC1/UbiB family)